MPLREARRRFERRYFRYWLKREGRNITRIAKACGHERTAVYRKLWGLGISTRRLKARGERRSARWRLRPAFRAVEPYSGSFAFSNDCR